MPILKVLVIDRALYHREDGLEDQVLASWPPAARGASHDLSLLRLAHASIDICSSFSQDVCNHVAFDHLGFVIMEVEKNILWVLQAPSSYGRLPFCPERACEVIRQMHGLFCLLYRTMADAMQSCGLLSCKSMLSDFLQDYMPAMESRPTSLWSNMTDLYSCLTPHRGLPLTVVTGDLFHGIQTLAASLKATAVVADRHSRGVMLAFKQAVLHSTLSAKDSEALYLLASKTIIPATRAENKTTRTLHKIYTSVADWAVNSQRILDPASWRVCPAGDLEGCITCNYQDSTGNGLCPLLYEQGRHPCRLTAWQTSGFQVLLLVDGQAEVHSKDLAAARRIFLTHLQDLESTYKRSSQASEKPASGFLEAISELLRTHEKGHIAGYRYSLTDLAAGSPFCIATPASKLAAATSQSAQAVLTQLWTDAQHHMAVEEARWTKKAEVSADSEQRSARDRGDDAVEMLSAASEQKATASTPPAGKKGDDGQSLQDAQPQQAASTKDQGGPSVSLGTDTKAVETAQQRVPCACKRMEIAAHTPGKKWVTARWSLGSELLQIDDTVTRDSYALAAAGRNVQSMLNTYFPGSLGF